MIRRNRDTAAGFLVGWSLSGLLIWALDINLTFALVALNAAGAVFLLTSGKQETA